MSVEAKQSMLKNLEKEFGHILTADNISEILQVVADELESYSVEQTDNIEADITSNDMLDSFLLAKQLEGRSPKTIERYGYIIKKLLYFTKVSVRSITVYHLRRFLMEMKERGCADSTLEGIREVFSSFFNWLQKEKLIEVNPCINLAPIKCMKKQKLPFSNADIEKLKEQCATNRDKAIVCFLLSTGCRISEVIQLNKSDIDFQHMQCKVLGKGNKERIVYIDDVTALLLNRYFSERSDTSEALFVGKGTSRLTPGGIRLMLRNLGERAQVNNVHPHRFRRTLATNLIHRGMPVQEVAKILGHEKLDTTMKYVYIDNDSLKFAYNKFKS